jgi:hypothetical protein
MDSITQEPIIEKTIEKTIEQLKHLYIESLSKKEKKAYDIAFQHLGSSFTLEKSVGFLEWIKSKS